MSESSSPIQASTHPLTSQRERLVQARYQRGWSQQELADLLGTTPLNISRWERGLTTPNPHFRHKLCALFGLNEIELGLRADVALSLPHKTDKETGRSRFPLYDPFLPLPAAVLLGRTMLLDQLKSQLAATRKIALSALHGLPGVGKTSLALELAYDPELRERYPDGLLWAALGLQPNLPGLLSRWGRLLGITDDEATRISTSEDWARTLRGTIGNRRLLFVLDDAWSLQDALSCQVGGPQCAYLLTTRLPQLAQSFAITDVCTVETLDENTSLELLRQLAPWAVEQAEARLRPLVLAVGGLPLALCLIGHYLRLQTHDCQPRRLQGALKRLQDRLTRLQLAWPRMPGERNQEGGVEKQEMLSLEAVIHMSARQVDGQLRQGWLALSVLPARPYSFSEAAALAVSAGSAELLDALSDAGLIEAVGPARYSFHQTIADYGRAHLPAAVQQGAFSRLISYSVHYAEKYSKNYADLEQEASVLSAALRACGEQSEDESLLRLTLALAPSWKARGDYTQADTWLPRAASAAQILKRTRDEASVRLLSGEIAIQRGDYEQALTSCQQALSLAHLTGEPEQICASLIRLGSVKQRLGEYQQAEQMMQEGLTLARQHGLQWQQAGLLRVLGAVLTLQGKVEQGQTVTQDGFTLAQQVGDHELMCVLLNNLAVNYHRLNNIAQAIRCHQDGLALARQQGYRHWEGILLANLGGALYEQGEYEQAEHSIQEGLDFARRFGNPEHICQALLNLGDIALVLGEYERAESLFQDGLPLARQVGNPEMMAKMLVELGLVSLLCGSYEQAGEYLREGLHLGRQMNNADRMYLALTHLGEVAMARGDYKLSEKILQEGLSLAREANDSLQIYLLLILLAEVALARGNLELVEQYLQEGQPMGRGLGNPRYACLALTNLGMLATVRGENQQAEQFLQEGLLLARQMRHRRHWCKALYQWGLFCIQRKQVVQAVAAFEELQAIVPAGARLEEARTLHGLAQVAAVEGKRTQARELGTQALTLFEALGHVEAMQVRQWLEQEA